MKKALAIIISAVMVFVGVSPVFAQGEKTAAVIISGMDSFPLYSENGEQAFPFTTNAIMNVVKSALPATLAYFVNGDTDKLVSAVNPVALELVEPIDCNPDGSSVHNINTNTFPLSAGNYSDIFDAETKDESGIVRAAAQYFGEDNTFFFNYDWRLDPIDHADDLNDFIKNVKEVTGCTKLVTAAFSMGGTVLLSYLYKYGSADVDTIVLASTAFLGTTAVGELFAGKTDISTKGLIRRLGQLTRNENLEKIIDYMNEGLELNGISGKLDAFFDKIVSEGLERIYGEVLSCTFGYMPGMWALCDDENFEQAKAFMLSGADEKLIERIDEYHYGVQLEADNLLRDAKQDSLVYIIAQYNMQGLPTSPVSATSNNDYLIDTTLASGGAICADLGETLGEGYTQAIQDGCNHLSPDGQIDASTCLFPDSTWFIRDMGHVDYPVGGGSDLIMYLLDSDTQLTISESEYPQFLTYSYTTGRLTPVENEKTGGFIAKVLAFFSAIRAKFYALFGVGKLC